MKSSARVMCLSALALLTHEIAWSSYQGYRPLREHSFVLDDVLRAEMAMKQDLETMPPSSAGAREIHASASGGTWGSAGMTATLSAATLAAASRPAPSAEPEVVVRAKPGASRNASARFDLVVNNAPAAQVFLQLGAGAGANVLVPPDVSGTVSLSLKSVTLNEALEAMRELYGYDFRYSGNSVFVYPNTVQTRIYRVNYLPGRRQGDSDLRVSSTSISTSRSTSGTGGSTSSSASGGSSSGTSTTTTQSDDTAHVKTTSDADFWRDVQASLRNMVGNIDGRSVVINAGAGVIVVRATPAELRHVTDYLKAVQLTIERQVMLEAKIIEVSLKNESQAGINWTLFRGANGGSNGKLGAGVVGPGATLDLGSGSDKGVSAPGVAVVPTMGLATSVAGKGFYGLAFQAANFAALLNFLESQGQVQVLSSPRIATLNNQKAVLKVGNDEMFVVNITPGQTNNNNNNGGSNTTLPTVELKPFFSGIVLDVTPQISDNGSIMLHIHPSISTVTEKNKAIELGSGGTYSLPLPISAISETDSIVRVQDQQIVAIGGLMTQQATSDRSGVPGLHEMPIFGGLFKQKSSSKYKRELVVLIKPTVIGMDGDGFGSDRPATALLDN